MENLVIVESPAKAKTFQKYLGKDFTVKASFGHIRDLQDKKLSINVEKGFEPEYVIPSDKRRVVSELRKAAADLPSYGWLPMRTARGRPYPGTFARPSASTSPGRGV